MSSRNQIFAIAVILFAILAMSATAYLFFHQPATSYHSLLLYTNYQSPEAITNWIVDTDTGEKWEVGKGLVAKHWSPSGKYLLFHTLPPASLQIWVGDEIGGNMHQVLDARQYPDLEIKEVDWLNDEIILVNVFSNTENYGFLYSLNINTLSFNRIGKGNFLSISKHGHFWIQWIGQNVLADLSQKTTPLPAHLGDFYFSPTEDKVVYVCSGEGKYSSLCVASVSIAGITDEQRFVDMRTNLFAFGEIIWSPDGRLVGFLCSPNKTETRFCAINVFDGSVIYQPAYPSQTTRIFWSPRGDQIIDWDGLLIDLKTGKVSNFFRQIGEAVPSYVVDWRLIELP
jgi:hypothetical protein